MKKIENPVISEVNLKALAKSIYQESTMMGFNSNDYIKLTNEILGMTIDKKVIKEIPEEIKIVEDDDRFPLKTQNLKIREYSEKKDKKIIEKWFEDETSRLFLLSTTSLQNLNIDFISSDNKNIFATITLKNDLPIGLLAILNIDHKNKKGEMRKLIGDLNYRGKGFAKEASIRWIDYCTNSLELRKIYINTIETNINNISLNRQLGFEIEGLFKKDIVLDGIEHDVLRMAYFKT
ncbi:MAG: GNAT family N-acetyltransferase [Ignavibacteriae bacterium]|nr:GNAT family N-acetyltransferase [Ignavibacteriota bacterium]